MELWRLARARGQGPRSSRPAFPAVVGTVCLLLRLSGCADAGPARGALGAGAAARPAPEPDSPRPRLPRQAAPWPGTTSGAMTTHTVPTATGAHKHSNHSTDMLPTCGFSFEKDPTLRDPSAMTRRWPWMVSVRANGTHICAGTLIASQWVVVVAHCLVQRNVVYSVLVGSPVLDEQAQHAHNVLVGQIFTNRKYRPRQYWLWVGRVHDIGLLKLQSVLKYNKYVWPICLPGVDFELKDHSVCTVTGWGLPRTNGIWPQSRSIQEKEVTILNKRECEQYYHRASRVPTMIQVISSHMFCAEDTKRDSFCYENTGEPLACPVESTWYLVGLVSWGPGCHRSEAPPIYLQVSSYQQWIWDRLNGQPLALPAPSRALFLALPVPLSLLVTL